MTTLVARQPLQPLSMSSSQRGPRRLSARLQEKEDAPPATNGYPATSNGASSKRGPEKITTNHKRKMIDYDEDDDGFLFRRAKTRKTRQSNGKATLPDTAPLAEKAAPNIKQGQGLNKYESTEEPLKKRKNKLSFSTPQGPGGPAVRRSKRLSDEHERRGGSPHPKGRRKADEQVPTSPKSTYQEPKKSIPAAGTGIVASIEVPGQGPSPTKIALPFADTPVIRRNKAMREGKSGKGERRSSLGLRGRRASSLIDSGTSNVDSLLTLDPALPHQEVAVADFYKHIESEGLPEPRRMKQLLTWCATRALDEKPSGTEFEDQSVRLAARVIEEELLKDFANRSEMSDWFGREDVPQPITQPLKRPNPKNEQNAVKIQELGEQIRRLQAERQALEILLKPPSIPPIPEDLQQNHSESSAVDKQLLSETDAALLESLASSSEASTSLQRRLNSIATSLGPTIDTFADGIHKIRQYQEGADQVTGRLLRICAEKLEDREKEGRRRALASEGAEDVIASYDRFGGVFRSLSKLDQ